MSRRRTAAGCALAAYGLLLMTADRVAAQQPPHWRFFTSSDGLRESWVLDATPGSAGRWWIAHGNVDTLSVFDGYTIQHLPSPGSTVTIREGPGGQLLSLLPLSTRFDVYVGLQYFENGRWIVKVNPVAAWSRRDTWAYLKEHALPHNPLYDLGYASIGCAPCTRVQLPGEHEREGRWAGLSKWECGIQERETAP